MSSSQRKKERRQQRYERNVRKEKEYKEQAWENGKLIEPNHNNGPYPADYCVELGKRLFDRITTNRDLIYQNPSAHLAEGLVWEKLSPDLQKAHVNSQLVFKFRLYRIKIRDFILHYNPGIPKTPEYKYLKRAIEEYWDNPDNLYSVL